MSSIGEFSTKGKIRDYFLKNDRLFLGYKPVETEDVEEIVKKFSEVQRLFSIRRKSEDEDEEPTNPIEAANNPAQNAGRNQSPVQPAPGNTGGKSVITRKEIRDTKDEDEKIVSNPDKETASEGITPELSLVLKKHQDKSIMKNGKRLCRMCLRGFVSIRHARLYELNDARCCICRNPFYDTEVLFGQHATKFARKLKCCVEGCGEVFTNPDEFKKHAETCFKNCFNKKKK